MAVDLLSTIQSEIDVRLSELRPLLAEYERLLVAADALVETGGASEPMAPTVAPATVARTPRPARTRRATRGTAAGVIKRVAVVSLAEEQEQKVAPAVEPKAERAQRGAAREAILAALEHGSHTVGELAVVTAMSGPNINGNLRRLVSEGTVVKTEREGKMAYALPA